MNSLSSPFSVGLASSFTPGVAEAIDSKISTEGQARVQREHFDIDAMAESDYRRHLRMTRAGFHKLLERLLQCPSAKNHFPQPGIGLCGPDVFTPRFRLAVALWYLATPDSIRSIRKNFGITDSGVHDSVTAFCLVIRELEEEYVYWPSEEEQRKEMATFWARSNIAGCIGAVDGTHIKILRPHDSYVPYFNRKQHYSINVMLTVNSQEEIIHYSNGSPGSYHDARVYRRSTLPEKLAALPADRHVLGDSAYPLSMGLITPYAERQGMSRQEKSFNFKHSSCRMIVENANGRLKQKWRRLLDLQVHSISRAKAIIKACIILHNFLLKEDAILARAETYTISVAAATPAQKRDAMKRLLAST